MILTKILTDALQQVPGLKVGVLVQYLEQSVLGPHLTSQFLYRQTLKSGFFSQRLSASVLEYNYIVFGTITRTWHQRCVCLVNLHPYLVRNPTQHYNYRQLFMTCYTVCIRGWLYKRHLAYDQKKTKLFWLKITAMHCHI